MSMDDEVTYAQHRGVRPSGQWLTIPVSEFERLHGEIRAWRSLAEDYRAEVDRLKAGSDSMGPLEYIAFLRAKLHEHDPQSCAQCSGHPLDR